LHKRSPFLALTLAIGLFALAGIPPFVGFMGKFYILVGALKQDYIVLVTLAAINTAIAIYYYLSVVRVTYCSNPAQQETVEPRMLTTVTALILLTIIVAMGVQPQRFIDFAQAAIQSIM